VFNGSEIPAQIYHVPIRPSFMMNSEGKLIAHLSYDSWVQFSTDDFEKMQDANGQLIVAAINALPELLEERGDE